MRAVFCAKALDGHHVPRLQRVLAPSLPVYHIRRAALERPVHYFAILAFHIQIKVDMRIHEFHLGNSSGEREGTVLVELHCKSVVRKNRRAHGKKKESEDKSGRRLSLQDRTSNCDSEYIFLYN